MAVKFVGFSNIEDWGNEIDAGSGLLDQDNILQPYLELEKLSVPDPSPNQISFEPSSAEETTYEVLEGGSERGGDMLFDSNGYSYTVQKVNPSGTRLWRCSARGRNPCPASIREVPNGYAKGLRTHNHPGKPGTLEAAKISKRTKDMATNDYFRPATQIAEQVLRENISLRTPTDAHKPVLYLARNANYARKRLQPEEPSGVDFQLQTECIPQGFLVKDIRITDARHIVLSTEHQLGLLKKAKTWYMDANVKVVRAPFAQLFSIHAFVRSGSNAKQLPLLFALMSRRRKMDYVAVFRAVLEVLGRPRVKRLVLDFERATWKAVNMVLPAVEIKGCAIHFTQAIFHQIKDLGLQKLYKSKNQSYQTMKKLMSLCYLPGSMIPPTFNKLRRADSSGKLEELFRYMQENWIKNSCWSPENWSVYGTLVRTMNDVEEWHHSLNIEGRPNMPFYMLVSLLNRIADLETGVRLVLDSKIHKRRRKASKDFDAEIYKQWKKFNKGKRTAKQIHRKIARVTDPCQ